MIGTGVLFSFLSLLGMIDRLKDRWVLAELAAGWKDRVLSKRLLLQLVKSKASERAEEVSHGINKAGNPQEALGTQFGLSSTHCKL